MMLMLFLIPTIFELILVETPLWRWRKILGVILLVLLMLVGPAAFLLSPSIVTILYVFINAFRLINIGRIFEARMHSIYLQQRVRQTSRWLLIATLILCGLYYWHHLEATNAALLYGSVVALLTSVVTGLSLARQLTTSRTSPIQMMQTSALPTLTVAIPARDESDDLAACLRSVLANDYPKLEILVLDDHSRNKKTAETIRGFAHDGVRFIPAEPARRNWLAKNMAYQSLARQANGDLILFCGVDIRFQPDSLRQLVSQLHSRNKQILSVVPLNNGPYSATQTMRYAWELALPRRLFNRPAVLSSCWLIKRSSLRQTGGFAAVTRMVVPESFFARQLIRADGYSLLKSGHQLGISSEKPAIELWATAIRTRYPQVHKRIELVAMTSLISVVSFVLPLPLLVVSIARQQYVSTILLTITIAVSHLAYRALIQASYRTMKPFQSLTMAAAWDIWLLFISMWRYEFGKVLWKGRDVTPAVMHATPHLPKLT